MYKSLVKYSEGPYYVPISHNELDSLVGRLMQICDIMGDTTQREAVKSEIKFRAREWLDSEYKLVGYFEPTTPEKQKELEKISTLVQSPITISK